MTSTESRKRPSLDDDGPLLLKKRALIGQNGSPVHINGTDDQPIQPRDEDGSLELFRKEAIYRRMKHYSRQVDRSEARMTELQQQRDRAEAGLAASEACWIQMIDVIRSLLKTRILPVSDLDIKDVYDLAFSVASETAPILSEALQARVHATESLVSELLQHVPAVVAHDETLRSFHKAQAQSAALRAEVAIMRARLADSESQLRTCSDQLVTTQAAADRLQSKIDFAGAGGGPLLGRTDVVEEVKDAKVEEKVEPKVERPSSPEQMEAVVNGTHKQKDEESAPSQIATLDKSRIMRLEKDNQLLQDQVYYLTTVSAHNLKPRPDDQAYETLLGQAKKLEEEVNELRPFRAKLMLAAGELDELRTKRRDHDEQIAMEYGKEVEDLKTLLGKRDAENTRLRQQRDQQLAELNERKQKESAKLNSLQESKLLSDSNSERITVMQSEIARLKARLAANAGDEDLMAFFFRNSADDNGYIDDLRTRLSVSESKVAALESTLSSLQETHPDIAQHMRAEAGVRQQLTAATDQLGKYKAMYGDLTAASLDVCALAEQLQSKEQVLQTMRLQETYRVQAEASLYAELDKLSAAWETLDRQVKSKVFDLSVLEDRLNKAGLDKAKSENKFFSAMRDKEAIETERKNTARTLEKQVKLSEKLLEAEKSLTSQVSTFEKQTVALLKTVEEHKDRTRQLEKEGAEWKQRAEGERARCIEFRQHLADRERSIDKANKEITKLVEELTLSKKEVERQVAKAKAMSAGPSSVKEAELQAEVDKCMSLLKCSTCKLHFRSMVITKCMHSFCKECVDTRLSTRQRKCPACNLPFGQADAQTVYFQ